MSDATSKTAGAPNDDDSRYGMEMLTFWKNNRFWPSVAMVLVMGVTAPTLRGDEQSIASFEHVWNTINERYWDDDFNGTDWASLEAPYRSRIEAATSNQEVLVILNELVSELGQSHFAIIPSRVYDTGTDRFGGQGGHGVSGLTVRFVDGEALVIGVAEGSAAEAVGIRAGFILESIDDVPTATWLTAMQDEGMEGFIQQIMLQRRVDGELGEKIPVMIRDGLDENRDLLITLGPPTGTPSTMGHLPTQYVEVEVEDLPDGIGYFGLSSFFDPMLVNRELTTAMTSWKDATGIIIDLRGNTGGIIGLGMGMGGWFVKDSSGYLGTMKQRNVELRFVLFKRATPYLGPVAILVDELSLSTSEIVSGGLQDLGRARIFGTKTGGAALPSVVEQLPNGDRFQYAMADFISFGGTRLEGVGVTPDEVILRDRTTLLSGDDPVIEAARAWILSQSTHGETPTVSQGSTP